MNHVKMFFVDINFRWSNLNTDNLVKFIPYPTKYFENSFCSGCKDIGNRKFEHVAKTEFFHFSLTCLYTFSKYSNYF